MTASEFTFAPSTAPTANMPGGGMRDMPPLDGRIRPKAFGESLSALLFPSAEASGCAEPILTDVCIVPNSPGGKNVKKLAKQKHIGGFPKEYDHHVQ